MLLGRRIPTMGYYSVRIARRRYCYCYYYCYYYYYYYYYYY